MKPVLLALVLLSQYIHFTWQQSAPGHVTVYYGTTPGGPYPVKGCRSQLQKCNVTGLTPGTTYYFVAQEDGVAGYSSEVAATAK